MGGKGNTTPHTPWFVKSRRAQHSDDDETWIEGGVSPTLNAFDNTGESRATVLILDGTRVDDVRVYDDGITPCLKNRMGTGGNNVPFVAYSIREDAKADTFSATEITTARALQSLWPSVQSHHAQTFIVQYEEPMEIAIPIQDGRDMDKKQNGLGVGEEGDPSYTLDQTGAQSVAYFFDALSSNSMKSANPNSGVREVDVARTLAARIPDPSCNQGGHAIVDTPNNDRAQAYDEYNDQLGGDIHHAIRAGTKQSTGVMVEMQVRRLTPVECERLMGWPDNHTLNRADGKTNSDTTRYKMCGNGVASPVAQWIAQHITVADQQMRDAQS